ncbi:hypothetical protein HHX47_DHR2000331 [Lentinula edodes]|nr:hypothetical protein HHX47_DHR2000331 [Lentinula edodes]
MQLHLQDLKGDPSRFWNPADIQFRGDLDRFPLNADLTSCLCDDLRNSIFMGHVEWLRESQRFIDRTLPMRKLSHTFSCKHIVVATALEEEVSTTQCQLEVEWVKRSQRKDIGQEYVHPTGTFNYMLYQYQVFDSSDILYDIDNYPELCSNKMALKSPPCKRRLRSASPASRNTAPVPLSLNAHDRRPQMTPVRSYHYQDLKQWINWMHNHRNLAPHLERHYNPERPVDGKIADIWDSDYFHPMHGFYLRIFQRHCRQIWGMNTDLIDCEGLWEIKLPTEEGKAFAREVFEHGSVSNLRALNADSLRYLAIQEGLDYRRSKKALADSLIQLVSRDSPQPTSTETLTSPQRVIRQWKVPVPRESLIQNQNPSSISSSSMSTSLNIGNPSDSSDPELLAARQAFIQGQAKAYFKRLSSETIQTLAKEYGVQAFTPTGAPSKAKMILIDALFKWATPAVVGSDAGLSVPDHDDYLKLFFSATKSQINRYPSKVLEGIAHAVKVWKETAARTHHRNHPSESCPPQNDTIPQNETDTFFETGSDGSLDYEPYDLDGYDMSDYQPGSDSDEEIEVVVPSDNQGKRNLIHDNPDPVDNWPSSSLTRLDPETYHRVLQYGTSGNLSTSVQTHNRFKRRGLTFAPDSRSFPDAQVIFSIESAEEWRAGSIKRIFTALWRSDGKPIGKTFAEIYPYKPLVASHAKYDKYRSFGFAGGRLFYDILEDEPLVLPLERISSHFGHSLLECFIDGTTIHALPLNKVSLL